MKKSPSSRSREQRRLEEFVLNKIEQEELRVLAQLEIDDEDYEEFESSVSELYDLISDLSDW